MSISPDLPVISHDEVRDRLVAVTLETAAVGAFAWHRDEDIVEFTATKARLTGLSNDNGRVRAEDFFSRVHCNDVASLQDHIGRAERDNASYEAEFRFNRPDGREIWLGGRGHFHRVEGRKANSLFGANFDLTRIKRAERAAEDLASEMAHRLGNQFATVGAIARMILRGFPGAEDYHAALSARLGALQVPTRIAMRPSEMGMTAANVAAMTLHSFLSTGQIKMRVCDAELDAEHAQSMSLALYELATNAVKHGALSHKGGRVELIIEYIGNAPDDRKEQVTSAFELSWREVCPFEIIPPCDGSRIGFGTVVLDRMVRQGGGQPSQTWQRDGLHYVVRWKGAAGSD